MHFFDTHCHYADKRFDADRPRCLTRAREAGLEDALVCTTTADEYDKARDLAGAFGLRYALGAFDLAGNFARQPEAALEALHAALEKTLTSAAGATLGRIPRPCAVGEVGIDRSHIDAGLEKEAMYVLDGAAALAVSYNLPLSIHARGALERVATVLRKRRNTALRGVIHAFNGSVEEARVFLGLGFRLGFGCVLINPGARRIARVLAQLAPGDFVLETDAPFMVPFDRRGDPHARTEPEDIARVAAAAARIRGEAPQATASAAFEAARSLFP